jgi:hypothetical protein
MRPPHTPPNNEAELDERWLKIWAELRKNAPPSREGAPTERDRALQAAAPAGLFTRLHRFIKRLGIAPQRCGCAARAERWDRALLRWLRRGVRAAGPVQRVRQLTLTPHAKG